MGMHPIVKNRDLYYMRVGDVTLPTLDGRNTMMVLCVTFLFISTAFVILMMNAAPVMPQHVGGNR